MYTSHHLGGKIVRIHSALITKGRAAIKIKKVAISLKNNTCRNIATT